MVESILPLTLTVVFTSACLAQNPANPPTQNLPPLEKASWIWHPDAIWICHFRKTFRLDEPPLEAHILITADNGYELYVNGAFVGSDLGFDAAYWQSVEKYDIKHLLNVGENVIAVRGMRLAGSSGMIAAAQIKFRPALKRDSLDILTDDSWRATLATDPTGYAQTNFQEDSDWRNVVVRGLWGVAPWGKVSHPKPVSPSRAAWLGGSLVEPGPDFAWPAGAIFVRGNVPQSSYTDAAQAVWRVGMSRSYTELDTIGPSMLGHSLHTLSPAKPDGQVRLLFDAGKGLIGSPSVSHDGRTVFFSMVKEGEKFFRIYRIAASGGAPEALTSGPFNDFDPEPLPNGRIVFSSTRLGSRDEYHGNVGRSLFIMNADGSGVRPITFHIVGDNEPRLTADGHIAFIRQDNFMERAKVETHIHSVRPDGTGGQILLGPDRYGNEYDRTHAAENNATWLRNFGFGSPAPLPDGRMASLTTHGLMVSGTMLDPKAAPAGGLVATSPTMPGPAVRLPMELIDISPLPDGRLLCTLADGRGLGVLDLAAGALMRIFDKMSRIHSVVYLGEKPRPTLVRSLVDERADDNPARTGFLICQNLFITKQTNAELAKIKAVRVFEGRPFALRSARHQYAHIGVEAIELGTAPLAPDGSFFIEVPADRALSLQAVDGEGRSVINEISWIFVRPGERRSCVGCHSPRDNAPPNQRGILALNRPPVPLLGQGDAHRWRGNNAANGGVLNLQFDRFREVAAINLHSRALLAPDAQAADAISTRGRDVEGLTALLQAKEPDTRLAAVRRLAIFRDRAAASPLAAALSDAHSGVRMNAALALSSCGTRQSIAPLLKALDDSSAEVAQAAHIALSNLTGHEPPFNAYGPPSERKPGAEAWRAFLAANDWEKIERGLIAQLKSDDPAAVEKSITALGHVGGDAARESLRQFLANDRNDHLRASLAAMRALGHLRDTQAVELLAKALAANMPKTTNAPAGHHEFGWTQRPAHLAGAAAEALGWIGSPESTQLLIESFGKLEEFWHYTYITGDHDWLMGCHASIPHYRIMEALDAIGARDIGAIVPAILKSVPIDTDRGLLFENDNYETVTARLVNRSGRAPQVIETCLSVLGDKTAQATTELWEAVTNSPPAKTVGPLEPESRAAQLLSIVCLEPKYAPRVREAFDRYRANEPSRQRSWTCFYLARALGNLRETSSVDSLLAALEKDATEASFGLVDPPNVFLYEAMTPFYRAAAAYSLGLIGERRAAGTLLKAVGNFDNAMDVRHAAALGLLLLKDANTLKELEKMAVEYPEIATKRVLLEACAAMSAPGQNARPLARTSN